MKTNPPQSNQITEAEVKANESIGWFIEKDGVTVKQIITVSPYEERVIGALKSQSNQDSELEAILEKVFTDMGIVLRHVPENVELLDKLEEVGENQLRPLLTKHIAAEVRKAYDQGRIDEAKVCEEAKRHQLSNQTKGGVS